MKRSFLAICYTILASTSVAQLGDAEAILEARRYMFAWSPEVLDERPLVTRDTMELRGELFEYTQVRFGAAIASLKRDGSLISFSIRGPALYPKGGAPDKFETDEAAWRALEELFSGVDLDLPRELERHTLERVDHAGMDCVVRLKLRLRPFGYETRAGYYAVAELHRITGRLLYLSLPGKGWTYEPPNVQVSEAQAIEKAVDTLGGVASEWSTELKYATTKYDRAPAYFRPLISQQVSRLLYRVLKRDGHGVTSMVIVDSVTGAVVDSGTLVTDVDTRGKPWNSSPLGSTSPSPTGTHPGTPSEPAAKDSQPSTWLVGQNSIIAIVAAGSLVVVAGVLAWLCRGRATP